MKDFRIIFLTHIKTMTKSIASINAIRLTSFIFVIGCFLAGAFYILFRIFTYLMTIEIIGPLLMDRIIEMAFFVFFIMLLFSNVITSFSTFYNDRELDFLFSLPVRPTSIYLAKLFENCIYASWATMVIALPLVVAYGITTGVIFPHFNHKYSRLPYHSWRNCIFVFILYCPPFPSFKIEGCHNAFPDFYYRFNIFIYKDQQSRTLENVRNRE